MSPDDIPAPARPTHTATDAVLDRSTVTPIGRTVAGSTTDRIKELSTHEIPPVRAVDPLGRR